MTKSSQTTEYFFAEVGIRVKKLAPGGTTYYLDIYAGEKLIASIDELCNITFNHQDHLGSSKLRTDSSGLVVKTIEHFPFGLKRVDSGSYNAIKFRFTSQYENEESDLYYFKQRYYNSSIGRFISADPLYVEEMETRGIDTQELNVYAYSRKNPINRKDDTGNFSQYFQAVIEASFGRGEPQAAAAPVVVPVLVKEEFAIGASAIIRFEAASVGLGMFVARNPDFFNNAHVFASNLITGATFDSSNYSMGDFNFQSQSTESN